jgi:hypothetical protein
MLQPFLFVGVGGSGGKTLRVLREELQHQLAGLPWERPLTVAWQFVQIDVPYRPDGDEPDLPAQLPAESYLGLVGRNIDYKVIDRSLLQSASTDSRLAEALVGWRPNPEHVHVNIMKGAGQFRALGRTVASSSMASIGSKLRSAVNILSGPEVTGELATLSELLGYQATTTRPTPVAIVVSSLAGGAGAGIFLDVCDALRVLAGNWGANSVGILYAPDIFNELREGEKRGVQPNALAALSETVAGYWNNESAEGGFSLLARAGIDPGAITRRGPRYPFIVGASNGLVSFLRQNDIYRAMGKTLAAWTLSEQVQSSLGAYLESNWQSQAQGVRDNLGLQSNSESPLNALGSGAVTTGRDRFAVYAAERLARLAIERVLRAHWEGHNVPKEVKADVALEQAVRNLERDFVAKSGLDEVGEDNNQILDALRPADREARLEEIAAQIGRSVREQGRGGGQPAARWIEAVVEAFEERERRFDDQELLSLRERARQWVESIQVKLVDLTADTIGAYGAPVAARLVATLIDDSNAVIADLERELTRYEAWSAKRAQRIAGEFAQFGTGNLGADHPFLQAAIDRGVQGFEWRGECAVCRAAIDLVADLRDSFLRPLLESVRRELEELSVQEAATTAGQPSVAATWPTGDMVPSRFEPATNERIIDPVAEYPEVFVENVMATVGADDPTGAVRQAVVQVITGRRRNRRQSVVVAVGNWVPRTEAYRPRNAGPMGPARFEVRLGLTELLDRAGEWVRDPDSSNAIGRYVRQPLREYLDPEDASPEEHARRLNRFREAFIAAIDTSAPLVLINNATLNDVHGETEPRSKTIFTEIPFPDGTPASEVARRVLIERNLLDPETERSFGEGPQTRIDVFNHLQSPYQPAVFDSLMIPIADTWAGQKADPQSRNEFWRWRRSRPLPYFVPLVPTVRRAMVRGWWTALVLNMIESPEQASISVYVLARRNYMPFPYPLLGPEVYDPWERLPALLESLPLAWVEVNRGNPSAIQPYVRLRGLGQTRRGADEPYDRPNAELHDWIVRGVVQPGAPKPIAARAGEPSGTAESRQKVVVEFLERQREQYHKLLDTTVDPNLDGFFGVSRAWELRRDIFAAFNDLITALRHLPPVDGPDTQNEIV